MKKLTIFVLLLATIFLSLFFFRSAKKPNILVILIDTLRRDHLGFAGYERDTSPNLDNFAKENVDFTNTIATSSWTPPTVASIFTGLYPSVHGHMPLYAHQRMDIEDKAEKLSKLDDSFTTLAEEFSKQGYRTEAIVANPIVSMRYGLAQGFDEFYSSRAHEAAGEINKRAIVAMNRLNQERRPFLLYLHYMDAHSPYKSPPEFGKMFSAPLKDKRFSEYDETALNKITKYDQSIRFIDHSIGEIFQHLKNIGLYDDMTIIVLADHGEQFNEHGFWAHGNTVYSEEIHVPFLMKFGNKQGKINSFVSQVDVLPTLLETAKIKNNLELNGVSLLSQLDERMKMPLLSEITRHQNMKAFISQDAKKLIGNYEREQGLTVSNNIKDLKLFKLFDLSRDPLEKSALEDPEMINQLRLQYYGFYDQILTFKKDYKHGEMDADEETLEQLKSLGYL